MSKFEQGGFVALTTGNDYIVLDDDTLNISSIAFSVNSDSGNTSVGYWDATEKYSENKTHNEKTTSKSIIHYRTISGVKTKVLSATVTSVSTGEFVINIDTVVGTVIVNTLVKGS